VEQTHALLRGITYVIRLTQFYLPPDSGDFPAASTPAEAGARFNDYVGMIG